MLPDIHKVGQEFHDRGNGTLGRNEISLPTPLNSPIKISNVQKSDDLKFQSKHEYYGDSLSKKRKLGYRDKSGDVLDQPNRIGATRSFKATNTCAQCTKGTL